jgi:hypothetical protein
MWREKTDDDGGEGRAVLFSVALRKMEGELWRPEQRIDRQ